MCSIYCGMYVWNVCGMYTVCAEWCVYVICMVWVVFLSCVYSLSYQAIFKVLLTGVSPSAMSGLDV